MLPLRHSARPGNARGLLLALALAWSAATGLAPREARASVAIAVSYEHLVASASSVALVTPLEARSAWEGARIVTYTRARVDRWIAGGEAASSEIWVRTLGGQVGDLGQLVDGEARFTVGEPSLLFLRAVAPGARAFVVASRAQGQFTLRADNAVTRLARGPGGGLVLPPQRTPRAATIVVGGPTEMLAGDVLDRMELSAACVELASAFAAAHRARIAPAGTTAP